MVDQSNPTLQRIREPDHARVPIDHPDVDGLRVEDLPDALAHEVVHALHLEVLGEATLHVVDERQLCGPLPRLFEEARVLKRDAQTAGERPQQPDVRITERVLAVEVLERDPARRLAADHQWHIQCRSRHLPLDHGPAELGHALLHALVDEQWFARLEDVMTWPGGQPDRLVREAHTSLERVGEPHQAGRAVDHADIDGLRVEDLLDPVPHEVIHRLHLEVLGQASLDVVDQRQLGVPLTRLLEQPCILQRDAQTSGEGRQQTDVGLTERMLAVQVLERDHALGLVADDQRDEDGRLGRFAGEHVWLPRLR